MVINYILYKDIDKQKWRACIDTASHGSVYALPEYLDALAVEWDALVAGDYETVMPLIKRKKYGIPYLYQPAFLPHTGIYSTTAPDLTTTNAFLKKAFFHFSFAEINVAYPLQFSVVKNMVSAKRNNFLLDLGSSYDHLYARYQSRFIKSLGRQRKHALQYRSSNDLGRVIELFRSLYIKKIRGIKPKDFEKFYKASAALQAEDKVVIREVYSEDKTLLCALLLLRFNNILYNIMSCTTAEGRKKRSNYFLYDRVIAEFSGKGLILDLEGSDIKGIADFYLQMNPVNEPYHFIQYNRLPALLKIFKKKP